MMRRVLISLLMLAGLSVSARAEVSDLFKENEGKVLDWAIASSREASYYRDFINGRNGIGAQVSIFYIAKYISGDVGYAAMYESAQRGCVTVGASLRMDRLIKDAFGDKVESLKDALADTGGLLDKLYFGPWYSFNTTENEHMAGLKAGFKIF